MSPCFPPVKLYTETVIEAPADRVWEIVGRQFDRIGDWATAIPASRPASISTCDATVPVAGRVCETGIRPLPEVTETIVEYDDRGRTLTYEGAGLPAFVALARNRWEVIPIDGARTRLVVEATLETRGLLARALGVPMRLHFEREGRRMAADLKHYAEHGRPSPRKQRRLDRARAKT